MEPLYVMREDWDYLIILDACRFDYFRKIYRDYVEEASLEKRFSPAIETIEWAYKNFTDYYDDVIYISTTPFINSKGNVSKRGYSFNGKKHFRNVIDVWDWGWDETAYTVRPKTVTQTVFELLRKYPDQRFIVHYMQPHAPYLSFEYLYSGMDDKISKGKNSKEIFQHPIIRKIKNLFLGHIMKLCGTEMVWRFNRVLGFRSVSPAHMEMAWRMVGKKGVRKAYEENLRIVLQQVETLTQEMNGKISITADHGELLGENGLYGHGPPLPRHNSLLEVPWLTLIKNE